MTARCVWCGALAFTDSDGDLLWAASMEQRGCEHELLEAPEHGYLWEPPARYFNFAAPTEWPDPDASWLWGTIDE